MPLKINHEQIFICYFHLFCNYLLSNLINVYLNYYLCLVGLFKKRFLHNIFYFKDINRLSLNESNLINLDRQRDRPNDRKKKRFSQSNTFVMDQILSIKE